MQLNSAKDLNVYKKAYKLAMDIFEISCSFPKEEKYSLTDQIRRSSRSVCTNLREAWAKRRYEAHFINKLTDVDGENNETDTWLDFARDCGYLNETKFLELQQASKDIGNMVGGMLKTPGKFVVQKEK